MDIERVVVYRAKNGKTFDTEAKAVWENAKQDIYDVIDRDNKTNGSLEEAINYIIYIAITKRHVWREILKIMDGITEYRDKLASKHI